MRDDPSTMRSVLSISGAERLGFLQGLVTNDVEKLSDGMVYAALLTPQGKYLSDFFLVAEGDRILLDAHAAQAESLLKRLKMYKLRADVQVDMTDLRVTRSLGPRPDGAHADPRHPDLGWRSYGTVDASDAADWDALRVRLQIPEAEIELRANETFILEAGFERINGVDFRKGCYVGQEVTARMKHKTTLRKGLAKVSITGAAPVGSDILAGEKVVGTLFTQSNGEGLAHLRFDQAKGEMRSEQASVTLMERD